jgi:hypothetical protein
VSQEPRRLHPMSETGAWQIVRERGIGVQIIGNENIVTVFAGTAELHLQHKHLRKPEPKNELDLLRVDLRLTTLVGRREDLSALRHWLTSEDRQVSVRCMST